MFLDFETLPNNTVLNYQYPPSQINREMEQFIREVDLPLEKRDCISKTLSGGMKRKLSVAIAFLGSTKTLILDEPTAGVDPKARRDIWDMIVKNKRDRTILLRFLCCSL